MIQFCWFKDARGISVDQEIVSRWGHDVIRASRKLEAIENSPIPIDQIFIKLIPKLTGSLAKEYGLRKIPISCRNHKERRLLCVHISNFKPDRILILYDFIEKTTKSDYQKAMNIAAGRLKKIQNNQAFYEQKNIKETAIFWQHQRIEKDSLL